MTLHSSHSSVLKQIVKRAHYISNQMIFEANHRNNKERGDPKVGGHSSATSSAIHILGALHLLVRKGFDYFVNKTHASPADHSYHYLLRLFLDKDLSRLSPEAARKALFQLRAFPTLENPYVFQSYHSMYDPDHHSFLPTGTVGIPPVNLGYLAHAYNFVKKQNYHTPPAHFWAVMGDSEFREGSLFEAAVDLAEREVGNLTWILDYNRQSLDGHRITNPRAIEGTDAIRIEKTMAANGWKVIQALHGRKRKSLFQKKGGANFQKFLETQLTDYELQALLLMKKNQIRSYLEKNYSSLKIFLKSVTDENLHEAFHDLGGHDIFNLAQILNKNRAEDEENIKSGGLRKPCFLIAHTLKGWGLNMAALSGNHSLLPSSEEMFFLRKKTGLQQEEIFASFPKGSQEDLFLKKRGDQLYKEIKERERIKKKNQSLFLKKQAQFSENLSSSSLKKSDFGINLKMASYPHTQWMLGQITSKMTRISNTDVKRLSFEEEKSWKAESEAMVFMSPDVGTSTNLNPSMDKKVFGSHISRDIEEEWNVKDLKSPTLLPQDAPQNRFLRFEIAEASSMSCLGSYGYMEESLGVPLLPLMTVYDFFIKRALDQYFYNLYWQVSFILVGTPSGVTLSPEGAQHAWKSDFQIPNQIIWEPFYCIELEWIFAESVKRHFEKRNQKRSGVLIRCVTRGINQKSLLTYLRKQARFKSNLPLHTFLSPKDHPLPHSRSESDFSSLSDSEILSEIRKDVLEGAYSLIDYSGYADYEVGENVMHIFAMGSLVTEAVTASHELLKQGIYANVIVVTSPDLLLGILGEENQYSHLKKILKSLSRPSSLAQDSFSELKRKAPLPVQKSAFVDKNKWVPVPIVSVHDGEVGILDNIGSILGVKQKALAVKKHSRCGTPREVYKYHQIDSAAIVAASKELLL